MVIFLIEDKNALRIKYFIFYNFQTDFNSNPDAFLFLREPVKVKTSLKSFPVLEGRLVMASAGKKKNLNHYAIDGYSFKSHDDFLRTKSESEAISSLETVLTEEPEQILDSIDAVLEQTLEEIIESTTELDPFEIVDNEEFSDQLATEIASEIIKEFESTSPENFLTEDGKSIITLPDSTVTYVDDSENVMVTATFPTENIEVDEFGNDATTQSTAESTDELIEPTERTNVRVNRYIESPSARRPLTIDNKPSILSANADVGKFFKDLRNKFEKNIPALSMKKEIESMGAELTTQGSVYDTNDIDTVTSSDANVYEFLTSISNNYDSLVEEATTLKEEKDDAFLTTESEFDTTEFTTHDPRFHFEIEAEDEEMKDSTPVPTTTTTTTEITTTTTSTEFNELSTTTPVPVKKYKTPKKKKSSSDAFNFFQEFTQEDVDILKSLFRNAAKTNKNSRNRRTKEKRSHPDEFFKDLLKKASPKLKVFAKSVINEEVTTTLAPETTTILSTTTDASLKTTLRTTPPMTETTTIESEVEYPEQVSNNNEENTANQEVTEDEPKNNRIDDTPHFKRAAQNSIFSSDLVSPFANLKEKFKIESQFPEALPIAQPKPIAQPLPQLSEANFKKPGWVERLEQETSEEREQRLEHDLQKMIKFVGILSKIDGFFMDRTKSAVRKLSTLIDDDVPEHNKRRKRRNQFHY